MHADGNADGQPGQAQQGIQIAARQPQQRPPRAAQKRERADHGKDAEEKARKRRGTGSRFKFLKQQRGEHRPQHKPDDFRPNVLRDRRPVQPQRSSNIALKTGHANAHILRIA